MKKPVFSKKKKIYKFNIVLETEHFPSFLPNLNEKGHVSYYAVFIILPKVFFFHLFQRCF